MKIQTLKYEYNSKEAPCSAVAQSRAKRYIANLQRKRKLKRKVVNLIFAALCTSMLFILLCLKLITTENRYTIPYDNGAFNYIYITERICTVTEITGDYITVYHNGNYYDFYGTGYVEGQTIVCQFTDDWEIVGVVE